MITNWIIWSFIASILTNMILVSGVLALIYYVGEKKSGWVFQHHDHIQIMLCWVFTLYLFLMSAVNGNGSGTFWGGHWTFFNEMIIVSFVFNLLMVSRVHWLGGALATFGYMIYLPGAAHPMRWVLTTIIVAIQYFLTIKGTQVWHRRAVIYPLLFTYGGIALVDMAIGAAPKDSWFWTRQVVAWVILAVATYEYARMLVQLRRRNNRYQEEAVRDRMTGLKNFGTFNTELQQLYQKHQATGQSFWLFELDVDHFKAINDTYGHLVGNTVLETVAKVTLDYAHSLPYNTAVYRMGGEEFCLLLRDGHDDEQAAKAIGEELRHRLASLIFHGEDGTPFHITVSVGAEYADPEDKHYLDIYNRVDQFLYAVKRSGRDGLNIHGRTFRLVK
ncbi:GGDEF domain-containing protein [Lacticaseibacillus porcinae]|uniref:GGDEF domain-containing protein n=1 Tax=Lacticaseibacillus porcinae TaxID=1123687 RepID=UPI000F7B3AED|nr:GGDEF domain-containing protein [Lacticaseibacillus porcinae]